MLWSVSKLYTLNKLLYTWKVRVLVQEPTIYLSSVFMPMLVPNNPIPGFGVGSYFTIGTVIFFPSLILDPLTP